jgi:hypothetical protein
MARTTVKVTAARLILALEAKKAELEEQHQRKLDEYTDRVDKALDAQRETLRGAWAAVVGGQQVETLRYADSQPSSGYHGFRLPPAVYPPRLDVGRYDKSIAILKLADPDALIPVHEDTDYARLLAG